MSRFVKPTIRLVPQAARAFDRADGRIQAALRRKRTLLEADAQAGVFVSVHGLHPVARRELRARLGGAELTNLYRLQIGKQHRALYTILSDSPGRETLLATGGGTTTVLILFFGDHKEYDRLLHYAGSS